MIVSVVVPVCNVDQFTGTLFSLSQQTRMADEIVMVIERRLLGLIPLKWVCKQLELPIVWSIIKDEDRGKSGKRRNIGAREARGDILLFVDDTILLPNNAIERMTSYYQSDSLAVSARILLCYGDEGCIEMPRKDGLCAWGAYRPWTNTSMIQRDVFFDVGAFDEDVDDTKDGWGNDDEDITYRIIKAGIPHVIDTSVTCIHLNHPRYAARGWTDAGKAYFHKKHGMTVPETHQWIHESGLVRVV